MNPPSHRRARLFKNAGNLAVRFPTDWDIDAEEAELEFDGRVITVTPIRRGPTVTDLHREFAAQPIDDDWGDDPQDSPAAAVDL
ncbi:MAG: hypothetical protein WCP28_11130 [Actinomycetes bacterium]